MFAFFDNVCLHFNAVKYCFYKKLNTTFKMESKDLPMALDGRSVTIQIEASWRNLLVDSSFENLLGGIARRQEGECLRTPRERGFKKMPVIFCSKIQFQQLMLV